MAQCTELWVDRGNLRNTQAVPRELAEPGQGEIVVAIDQFALTATNVTCAVLGERLWGGLFPMASHVVLRPGQMQWPHK